MYLHPGPVHSGIKIGSWLEWQFFFFWEGWRKNSGVTNYKNYNWHWLYEKSLVYIRQLFENPVICNIVGRTLNEWLKINSTRVAKFLRRGLPTSAVKLVIWFRYQKVTKTQRGAHYLLIKFKYWYIYLHKF